MRQLRILNKKEIKSILSMIDRQWGAKLPEYVYMVNNKGRVYITTRDVFDIDHSKIRIDSIGLYFGTMLDNQLRLSVEGSQIVGPLANKGLIDISSAEKGRWMEGIDIACHAQDTGFVILRHDDDFLGCSRIKDYVLKNYFPKQRRVSKPHL